MQEEDEEEYVKPLSKYYMPELQELISAAHKSWREEKEPKLKRAKKKHLKTIIVHYNQRAKFDAYKTTL